MGASDVAGRCSPRACSRGRGVARRAGMGRARWSRPRTSERSDAASGLGHSVPGSAPRALWAGAADVVLRLRGSHAPAALFIAVDSLLAALPRSRVVLDPGAAGTIDDPRVGVDGADADARVTWEVDVPLVVLDPRGITDLLARCGVGDVGTVELVDVDGEPLGVLRSRRAERRAQRWGTEAAFATERRVVDGVHRMRSDPRVEAWVGGWGGPSAFI